MSAIPTTFRPSTGTPASGLTVLDRLTEREIAAVGFALECGVLSAVADGEGNIVAVALPDTADELAARGTADAHDRLYNRLREATDELDSLRTIIGEVMAESRPQDFDYRLHDAAEDVHRALEAAIDASENL